MLSSVAADDELTIVGDCYEPDAGCLHDRDPPGVQFAEEADQLHGVCPPRR